MKFSMEDSTGLLRTDCRKVARPGVIASAEEGIVVDHLVLQLEIEGF